VTLNERVRQFVGQVFYLSVTHFFFKTTWYFRQFELNQRDAVGAKYFAFLLLHYLAVFLPVFTQKEVGNIEVFYLSRTQETDR